MSKKWVTKAKDLYVAQMIIESFAKEQNRDTLSLFELVVNQQEKQMNFRLSDWVLALAKHFNRTYGESQGDFVTRRVVSHCITQGQTIH